MTMADARGVVNKNPGNLIRSTDKWEGLATVQNDPKFFQFDSAPFGIRAMTRELIVYQDKHGCRTLTDIINRWAPPTENNTGAYIQAVASRSGYDASAPIDMRDYVTAKAVVRAMIMQECAGYQYDDAVLDKGLLLAGIQAPQKSLQESRTIKGGQIAAVTGAATAVTGVVQQAQDGLMQNPWIGLIARTLVANHPKILIALSAATLSAVAYMVWARIDDHRRGLR
jgi:hypothetical protein